MHSKVTLFHGYFSRSLCRMRFDFFFFLSFSIFSSKFIYKQRDARVSSDLEPNSHIDYYRQCYARYSSFAARPLPSGKCVYVHAQFGITKKDAGLFLIYRRNRMTKSIILLSSFFFLSLSFLSFPNSRPFTPVRIHPKKR